MSRPIMTCIAALSLTIGTAAADEANDTIFQISTIGAVEAGVFDGSMTLGDMAARGDQGFGTFNALDGVLVVVDGRMWRAGYDGSVREAAADELTPFATITSFEADESFALEGALDNDAFLALLDSHLADRNTPVAIRIDGRFAELTLRVPQRQQEPYPELDEALKSQAVWQHSNIDGTVVGFWFPDWLGNINRAGWHLHFISTDRSIAGHVLGLVSGEATVGLDQSPYLKIIFPGEAAFRKADLSAE